MVMATAQRSSIGVGIKNVLIATDFSHHSDIALRYGLEFAHLSGAQAEIVYVVPTDEFALAGPEGLHAAREAARRDLLEFKLRLRQTGTLIDKVDYRLTMLEGPVADCLLQCAREKKVDLLVVGTHGRRGLGKFVLGWWRRRSFVTHRYRYSPSDPIFTGLARST
jgi:nucleotide-binding universal stress UspA family protein